MAVTDVYKDIRPEIRERVTSLIPEDDAYLRGHKRRMLRTIQVILDQNPKGRLLELGTNGLVPLALKTLAPELEISVTNFDLDLPLESTLDIYLADESMQVVSFALDLEKTPIPAPDGYYDYVLCAEVIEHAEIDPLHILAEVNRVLRPGGLLILTTPNILSSRGITKMLAGVEPYFFLQYSCTATLGRHNYEYSVYSVAKILKAAGFEGSAWAEDTFEDGVPAVVHRLRVAGFDIRNTGDNIFAVSKKVSGVVDRYPSWLYA